jgi:hypothetical protein
MKYDKWAKALNYLFPKPVLPSGIMPTNKKINLFSGAKRLILFSCLALIVNWISAADVAWATQTHGEPEGLYAHQLAHLFFIFSMAILVYWLRARNLIKEKGWRHIQYGALLFILWSIDTFTVHLLDEQVQLVQILRIDFWNLKIVTAEGLDWLGLLYYLMKLDHLLCVPALLFLFNGLRRLHQQSFIQTEPVQR